MEITAAFQVLYWHRCLQQRSGISAQVFNNNISVLPWNIVSSPQNAFSKCMFFPDNDESAKLINDDYDENGRKGPIHYGATVFRALDSI